MEVRLGQGYQPHRGNEPAGSVFERVLPNALTAKSDELFAWLGSRRFGRCPSDWLAAPSR